MQDLFEILKYTIPSLVVFTAAYFILKLFLDKETEKRDIQLHADARKISLPIRLQAYERLVLLLERIEPSAILIRINEAGMSAVDLQNALLQSIRSEFEHNLSQQLYISSHAWDLVRQAREETVQRINTMAMKLPPDASGTDLINLILLNDIEAGSSAVKIALEQLKTEARTNFWFILIGIFFYRSWMIIILRPIAFIVLKSM